jgi:hypothetical protein
MIRALLNNDAQNKAEIRQMRLELDGWTSGISSILGPNDHLLEAAMGILRGTQNPLKRKLLELSAELRRRDVVLKAIWTRLSGIWENPTEVWEGEATENTSP